jgi:D-alanyl-D-alanine carboxypeptidase/Putative peptidoglycan binding domain
MSIESGSTDPNEPPLFDIDAMHEPDGEGDADDKGGPLLLEGVNIPFDILEYGNGQLPDTMLQKIGVSSHRLHPTAAAGFAKLHQLAAAAGIDLTCSDSYRTLDQQVALKAQKPDWSATPGRSVHGWGFAVDVAVGTPPKAFGASVLKWLNDNGPPNGWFMGRPKDEPWHWVYRGAGGATASVPAATASAPATSAPAAAGTLDPAITGSTQIALGATGVGVKILRGLLGLTPGDSFDAETDTAARAFQTAHTLTVDGKVGPITWAALRTATAPADRPALALNSTGDAVKWLQTRLALTIDGSFAAQTDAAVKAFQQALTLFVDGKVGPKTWAALTA